MQQYDIPVAGYNVTGLAEAFLLTGPATLNEEG